MGDQERRGFKRVAVDLLCAVTLPNGLKQPAMARNLSTGGLFIESDRPLSQGDRVSVALNLQLGGRLRKVEVESEVIHGPARVSMTAYGFGVRFVDMNEDAREVVERYVDARPALV